MYIHTTPQSRNMYIHSQQLITCSLFRFLVTMIVASLPSLPPTLDVPDERSSLATHPSTYGVKTIRKTGEIIVVGFTQVSSI